MSPEASFAPPFVMTHIVCVDAYEGAFEPIAEMGRARPGGLGLAWHELAGLLDARLTLLNWNAWYEYEERGDSPAGWMRFPSTRPAGRYVAPRARQSHNARISHRSVAVIDPEDDRPIGSRPLSKRAHGMLAEGDPLFFLSILLHRQLVALHREDPIDLVVVPMWGGLGYITQIEAQVGDGPLSPTSMAVVVTSTSRDRFRANQEGEWTRMSIARHQREELSLALADIALAFGNRSLQVARAHRLRHSQPPVLAPREALDISSAAGFASRTNGTPWFSLAGPLDGATGALTLLDAGRLVRRPTSPMVLGGEDRVFGPMTPRSFREYWSSRGWVRALEREHVLAWQSDPAPATSEIRLLTGSFAHLIDPTADLEAGRLLLLAPAAADALPGAAAIPEALLLGVEPDPALLAARLESLATVSPDGVNSLRSSLCAALAHGANGGDWEARLQGTADALRRALRAPGSVSLAQVMRRQADPRRPLVQIREMPGDSAPESATLTVVVPCFASGALIEETIDSIWRSSRLPDELIIVDDGSPDAATQDVLEKLRRRARQADRPLHVLRQENRGLAAARNAGLDAATGTFISFLDHDDLIDPSFYQLAVSLLTRERALGGVAAWAEIFGDEIGYWNAPQPELPLLLVENQVIVPVVTRTALLRALGGYDERQRYNYEDWELAIRYLAHGHPIVTIPRYLQRYRVRGDSVYRSMTPVQHQVMREVMVHTHATTMASFAGEVALQLEHRLAQRTFVERVEPRTPSALGGVARNARHVMSLAAARLRRIART